MLQLDADHVYADVLEQALYNGVLSGIGLDGSSFFYVNPLESKGNHHRKPWYKCACCPPNLARLLMSLGQYVYGVNETDILVHLYAQSTATLFIGGRKIVLHQQTNYPWDGTIRIEVELEEPAEFGLNLRIPGWYATACLTVAGEEVPLDMRKGYARITRRWQHGESLVLRLDMPAERVYVHPSVRADVGCVSLRCGPLIYCLESADNPVPLHQIRLPEDAVLEKHFDPAFLGGMALVQSQGCALETSDWSGTLYRTRGPAYRPYTLTAIPYYAWGHREPGEMRVYVLTR